MIGIDLTRISRFERIDLELLSRQLAHNIDSAKTAAKCWCCREAIIKAEQQKVDIQRIQFVFDKGCAPRVLDPDHVLTGEYVLSLSHEGDLVTAVALRIKNYT